MWSNTILQPRFNFTHAQVSSLTCCSKLTNILYENSPTHNPPAYSNKSQIRSQMNTQQFTTQQCHYCCCWMCNSLRCFIQEHKHGQCHGPAYYRDTSLHHPRLACDFNLDMCVVCVYTHHAAHMLTYVSLSGRYACHTYGELNFKLVVFLFLGRFGRICFEYKYSN